MFYGNFIKLLFSVRLSTLLTLTSSVVTSISCKRHEFIDVLNRHASIKKKVIRANHAPYVTKALRKAIMKRSQLEKIYFKKRTQESFKKYKNKKITAVDYTNEKEKVFLKAYILVK